MIRYRQLHVIYYAIQYQQFHIFAKYIIKAIPPIKIMISAIGTILAKAIIIAKYIIGMIASIANDDIINNDIISQCQLNS